MEFQRRIEDELGGPLRAGAVEVMQVNLGYRCNMSCSHCHLNAGPASQNAMDSATADAVLDALIASSAACLDVTGGAPELNPVFRRMVASARAAGRHVIARSNLTVFFEDGQQDLPEFYASHSVEVIASLPAYTAGELDRVRGRGTFEKSILALKRLNALGYGDEGSGLALNLVHNPPGNMLAARQEALEADYRAELGRRHGIRFNSLYAFSNSPIGRFKEQLVRSGQLEDYMGMIEGAFNPSNVDGLMCKRMISVAPDGGLYDCDFNQALGLGLDGAASVRDVKADGLSGRRINVGEHCYACTAGQGST